MSAFNTKDQICRSCMAPLNSPKYSLLQPTQFTEIYIRLSSTQLHIDDPLPKSICQDCHHRIKDIESFQTMCIESYRTLLLKVPIKEDFKEELVETVIKEEQQETVFSENLQEIQEELASLKSDIESDSSNDSDCDPLREEIDTHDNDVNKPTANNKEEYDSDDQLLSELVKKESSCKKQKPPAKRKKRVRTKNSENLRETKYTCDKCSKNFYAEYKYEAHLRKHQGLKPYACKLCPKGYSHYSRLNCHMLHDHSDNPVTYPCTFEGCEKVFSYKYGLQIHMKNMHISPKLPIDKSERPRFICDVCGKVLASQPVLRKHSMIHTNEFPYVCDICPKKYRTQDKLNIHKLKHQGIKRFECEICGLKKTTGHELNVHMMIHTKPKIHKCNDCPSSYRTPAELSRHIKVVHQGVKTYKCKYCDQRFGRGDTLKHHEMRHTGERRHECPICGKKFIQHTSFRMHVERHGKGIPIRKAKKENVDVKVDQLV